MEYWFILMWLNCNLGKLDLELMLPAVSPRLLMISGVPSSSQRQIMYSFALLRLLRISAFACDSLRIH